MKFLSTGIYYCVKCACERIHDRLDIGKGSSHVYIRECQMCGNREKGL